MEHLFKFSNKHEVMRYVEYLEATEAGSQEAGLLERTLTNTFSEEEASKQINTKVLILKWCDVT